MRSGILKTFVLFMVLFLCFDLFAFDFVQNEYENKEAPHFTLQDLTGKNVSLSDFEGKAVILFFWATWCPHCRRALSTLNREYKDMLDNDIELLAIDIGEPKAMVENFTKKYSMDYAVLLDSDASVANEYGVIGVPTIILISKEGKMVSFSNNLPYNYKDLLLK